MAGLLDNTVQGLVNGFTGWLKGDDEDGALYNAANILSADVPTAATEYFFAKPVKSFEVKNNLAFAVQVRCPFRGGTQTTILVNSGETLSASWRTRKVASIGLWQYSAGGLAAMVRINGLA